MSKGKKGDKKRDKYRDTIALEMQQNTALQAVYKMTEFNQGNQKEVRKTRKEQL